MGSLRIKENITRKYIWKLRQEIVPYYQEYLKHNLDFEVTNFWICLCTKYSNNEQFKNISINTVKQILHSEIGILWTKSNILTKKHPKSSRIIEGGHIQLDLRILGHTENELAKVVSILNMIDTRTRLIYSHVLEKATTNNVINLIEEELIFLKK